MRLHARFFLTPVLVSLVTGLVACGDKTSVTTDTFVAPDSLIFPDTSQPPVDTSQPPVDTSQPPVDTSQPPVDTSDNPMDLSSPGDTSLPDDLTSNDTSGPTDPPLLEYVCGDGSKIPLAWVCDGWEDCDDEGDEAPVRCTYFTCQNGDDPSIPATWVCDGTPDCDDGRDEAGCTPFICRDGGSIASAEVCDGYADCDDNSDELVPGCTSYICDSGETVIPVSYRCDFAADCEDESDEAGCP